MKYKVNLYIYVMFFCVGCGSIGTYSNYKYSHIQTVANISIPMESLDCNCHTQGIGWHENTESIVVTCQGKKEGYITLFKTDGEDIETIEFQDAVLNDADGRKFSHPSAIQIHDGIIPVAVAEGRRDSSFIYFYHIENNKIKKSNIPTLNYPKHIGAIGIVEWDKTLYLLGLGWDSKNYALWKSTSLDNIRFDFIRGGEFSSITDAKFGTYNSVWIGSFDNMELLLIASFGSFYNKSKNFIDIYSVDIKSDSIFLNKKERIQVKGVTKGTTKSLFFEGVTVKKYNNDTITILSAPQDFRKTKGKVFLKSIYKGMLLKK